MKPALELIERVRQVAGGGPHGRRAHRQWSGILQRGANRMLRLAEKLDIHSNAMSREQRLERVALCEQALQRVVVRGLAKPSAMRVAEDVGKEHIGVFAIGLEQKNIGVRILPAVFLHSYIHPGMDDRPKSLRQH